jgi:hypothetical protein
MEIFLIKVHESGGSIPKTEKLCPDCGLIFVSHTSFNSHR